MTDVTPPSTDQLPQVSGISYCPSRREWLYAWAFGEPGLPLHEALTRDSHDKSASTDSSC